MVGMVRTLGAWRVRVPSSSAPRTYDLRQVRWVPRALRRTLDSDAVEVARDLGVLRRVARHDAGGDGASGEVARNERPWNAQVRTNNQHASNSMLPYQQLQALH
jgi:hypothetical protein